MPTEIKAIINRFYWHTIIFGLLLLVAALFISTYFLSLYGSLIVFGAYFGSGVFFGLNVCLYYLEKVSGMGSQNIPHGFFLLVFGPPVALVYAGLALMGILSLMGIYK
jgi:hypothetical protein